MNAPVIILVQPQLPENIGMTARAMLNGGLTRLRLVRPPKKWDCMASRATSAGADEVLDNVEVFDITTDAVADLHTLYATTARPRDVVKSFFTPEQAIRSIAGNPDLKAGILMGGERSGLEAEDVALANGVIQIPVNPNFSSYNLAQATLVLSYEWVKSQTQPADPYLRTGRFMPATQGELDGLMDHLIKELDAAGFLRQAHMRPTMVRNICNIFQRIHMTEQEIRTFHGVIHNLAHPYKESINE